MTIDRLGKWWVGSASEDIQEFLVAYSDEGYKVSLFRRLMCGCGGDRFHLAAACEIARRICVRCGDVRYIYALDEDWEEAVDEEPPEECICASCGSSEFELGVGLAKYPQFDAVKWLFVGYRCSNCGVLGCFRDRKVGAGPVQAVLEKLDGL